MPRATEQERALISLRAEIESCRACPRLVEWRERVGVEKRAAYRSDDYWARPVGGFGDPRARIIVVGLAPGAHGANRTGRVFTGDRSGEWLYRAMHRAGLANQPESTSRDDGLRLTDAWVTVAVRCVPPGNKPTPEERDRCTPYLAREFDALVAARVVVCLGSFALAAVADVLGLRPRPRFAHGAEHDAGRLTLVSCYHTSQQNTFTGTLTEEMLDAVFARAVAIARA